MIRPMPRSLFYHIHPPIPLLALLLALLLAGAPATAAHAEPLAELLAGVARNARFATPLRADATITRPRDAAAPARRAILLGRGQSLYVEVEGGFRALIHPAKAIVAEGGRARRAPPGAALPGTDLLLEDLHTFTPATLALPQVSDDGPAGVVVTSAPSGTSAYSLFVFTIDREQHVIVKTQYYRSTLNNLVKIRRDTLADGRPATVDVDDLSADTATHAVLAWRPAPDAPRALFTPAGFRGPSGLDWR
jgi:hypothetical protein